MYGFLVFPFLSFIFSKNVNAKWFRWRNLSKDTIFFLLFLFEQLYYTLSSDFPLRSVMVKVIYIPTYMISFFISFYCIRLHFSLERTKRKKNTILIGSIHAFCIVTDKWQWNTSEMVVDHCRHSCLKCTTMQAFKCVYHFIGHSLKNYLDASSIRHIFLLLYFRTIISIWIADIFETLECQDLIF